MKDKKNTAVSVISGILASLVFLLLFIGLTWPLWICIPISVLLLFALTNLLQPTKKIGGTRVADLPQGERLSQIYDQAEQNLKELGTYPKRIDNQALASQVTALHATGQDILKVLSDQPQLLSRSEHFLSYYLGTADHILSNYVKLQDSHVSADKWAEVEEDTSESMTYLQEIFAQQRDSYHKNTMMDLEAESELLEKTVKLGGGRNEE